MEGKGLQGRIYPNSGVGMLGLEIPLHQSNQPQNPQIQIQNHQQQMLSSSSHLPQQHLQQFQQHEHQTQLSMQQPTNYMAYNSPNPNPNPNPHPHPNPNPNVNLSMTQKTQMGNSDEDEPGGGNEHENAAMDGKRKGGGSNSNMSPWQRMKWTDNMVRLLIMAVYYIGDEAGNEAGPEKKKSGPGGTSGGGGLLQKKGKWKSVSRAMMEKGFYVSPQQCEDKFNDLNKRYKRVNDILGKGTACKVVENQALLETMDISPKMKEEARKLLNSKHLFFREMCAYHNSCGHGAGGTTTTPAAEVQHNPQSIPNHMQQNQQQLCSHSGAIQHNGTHLDVNDDDDHDEDDDKDEDEDEDDDDEDDEDEDDDLEEGGRPRKRVRTGEGMQMRSNPQVWQRLNGEMVGMLQDGGKNSWEKKQWIKTQLVELEEQGLKFQYQALELEKQRMKWVRFSTKKEREMEKLKIVNERKRLENQRMVILMRQKEIELIGEQNPPCVSTC